MKVDDVAAALVDVTLLWRQLNPDMQKTWESDIPGHMTKADTNWSVIQDKAPAELGEAFGSA